MKSKLFLGIGVLLVFGIFWGCTGSSALIGKWVLEDDPSRVIVFLKDGSGTVYGSKMTWNARENGTLTISSDEYMEGEYSISGSVLTLTMPELRWPGDLKFKKSR